MATKVMKDANIYACDANNDMKQLLIYKIESIIVLFSNISDANVLILLLRAMLPRKRII